MKIYEEQETLKDIYQLSGSGYKKEYTGEKYNFLLVSETRSDEFGVDILVEYRVYNRESRELITQGCYSFVEIDERTNLERERLAWTHFPFYLKEFREALVKTAWQEYARRALYIYVKAKNFIKTHKDKWVF